VKKRSRTHAPAGTTEGERIFQKCTMMYAMLTDAVGCCAFALPGASAEGGIIIIRE
jgi:hypothetical protein